MSVYCPKDGKLCIDDCCNGGTCLLTGYWPYHKCQDCGAFYEVGHGCEECDYDYDFWEDDEEE